MLSKGSWGVVPGKSKYMMEISINVTLCYIAVMPDDMKRITYVNMDV